MDDARRVPLFEKQGDGEFEVDEADAQRFLDNHEDLHGAPLRCVRNKVDDSTVGGRVPHITVRETVSSPRCPGDCATNLLLILVISASP